MKNVCYEISKEDYEKAQKEGACSIIGEAILWGYGVYGAEVSQVDDKYYLSYKRGETCD